MPAAKQIEFGGHALVWVGDWSPTSARAAISSAARNGYDYIELAIFDPWNFDTKLTKDLLQEFGLRAHASLGLSAHNDVTSTDPAIVAKGDELLRKVADVLHELGGTELCGVIYSALAKYPSAATKENRTNSVKAMQRLEGLAFLDEVNRPNAYLHLDTYHMNIEEDGMQKSVIAAGDRLGYVHIGESHRGYLGSGNVDFDSFFAALKKINYKGPITFESFSSAVVDPSLSNTLCVWRNLWSDSDDLAKKSLDFMKARY